MENTIKRIWVVEASYEFLVDCCLETIAVEVLLTSKVAVMFFTLLIKNCSLATSVLKWNRHELLCQTLSRSQGVVLLILASFHENWFGESQESCLLGLFHTLNYFCKFEPV